MKNILVPTDFSACAINATKAGIDLADFFGAKLHLYTNLNVQYNWDLLSESEKKNYPDDLQTIHNAKTLFTEWKDKAAERNVEVIYNWSEGNLLQNIKDYVRDYNIDFIVMGSHGAGGKNDYLIGTNTQKVVRRVNTPVMIIKEDLSEYEIKKVVFASDFSESEKVAFQYLLDFVRPLQPEIHLVEINTPSWFTQPRILVQETMNDFKALCKDFECHTHYYRDWSVDSGVRHLSEEIGADLIAISNRQRHPLKRIFTGSNVEALVNHAKIPVLSIDFPALVNQ